MRSTLHLPIRERRLIGRVRRRIRGGHRHAPRGTASVSTSSRSDIAARRVREAGGPIDYASYVCLCGFVFAAAVSTSVECPHCGSPQAW